MNITVKAAREALDAAKKRYVQCDHKEVAEVKHSLDVARHEYWYACARLVEKLTQEDEPLAMYYRFREETL